MVKIQLWIMAAWVLLNRGWCRVTGHSFANAREAGSTAAWSGDEPRFCRYCYFVEWPRRGQ